MIGDQQNALDALYRKLCEDDKPKNGNGNGHHKNTATVAAFRTDAEIIEKCRNAHNAEKFSTLYDDGNTLAYHGGDDSAADLALVCLLAWYTKDASQLDRLFRGSALMREKWDRRDYRERTVNKALDTVVLFYKWPEILVEKQSGTGTGTPIVNGTGTGRRRSQAFAAMPSPEARRYIVERIVPESYPTIIYGEGGVSKSLLALSLGLAVASGAGSWLGCNIEPGNVLYLDFELDAPEQMRRVSQLAAGDGIETLPEGLRYMSAIGVRAREAFADALEECKEYGVKLLIVDSLGPALEGDAEASRDVIAFYNEVMNPFRVEGIAPLIIDHQSKLQTGERYQNKRAFGSVFKSNLARSVIQVEATNREEGELTVRLRQNKHNFGPLLKPLGAHLSFSEERISVEPVELDDDDLAEEDTINARERVLRKLTAKGEATRNELAEELPGLTAATVKKELSKLRKAGEVEPTGDVRDRQEVVRITGTGTEHYKGTGTGTGESYALCRHNATVGSRCQFCPDDVAVKPSATDEGEVG